MNKILVGAVIACLAASVVYKRWATAYTLKKLYRLRQGEESGPFMEALDSDLVRFHFSEFTRAFMKLKYWIGREAHGEVQALIPAFRDMKCSPREQTALYAELFGYTLEQGDYGKAQEYQKQLERLLEGRTDRRSEAIRREAWQLKRIYLDRDVSAIPELEEALGAIAQMAPGSAAAEAEAVICYRLAKLYYAKGEESRVTDYLQRALSCTASGPSRRKLEQALEDHSILK